MGENNKFIIKKIGRRRVKIKGRVRITMRHRVMVSKR